MGLKYCNIYVIISWQGRPVVVHLIYLMHDFSFSFFLNLNLSFHLQFFLSRCLSDSKHQQLNCSGLKHPPWRVPLPSQEKHSVRIQLSGPPTVWPESPFPAFLPLGFLSELSSLAMLVSSPSPNKDFFLSMCLCPSSSFSLQCTRL